MKNKKFDEVSLCRRCKHRFIAAFREKIDDELEDTNFVIVCLAADMEIGGMDCLSCNFYEQMEDKK